MDNIREEMFKQLENKELFNVAKEYAFDYLDNSLDRNVYPTNIAIENMKSFEEALPDDSSDPKEIIKQLHDCGSPATTSQIGGRYFGFVNGSVIPTALAVKWLNDIWDQNTPLYLTSPIASKLETVIEHWLKDIFHLPKETVAGFVSGSSMAILCGLAAARYRIYQRMAWEINAKGLRNAPDIRIITGAHTHATVLKAVSLLGLGQENIECVDVDSQGRIIPEKIPRLDEKTILILQAGNVNSGAFDSFRDICPKARKAKSWIHIDGAFGLWASASKKLQYLNKGMEDADSWSVDGHKTLNTPYDSGIILCRDKEALSSSLQASGSYILFGEKRDGMLYTPEMSRRARAIELWATLKYLGRKGVDELVLGLHLRAKQFARELSENGFKILNDVVFNQVLVACDNDQETESTLRKIQELRVCWCGGSQWFHQKVIRISVCSWATTEEDVQKSVLSFIKAREWSQEKRSNPFR